MDDPLPGIYKLQREVQNKYTYLLLAVAASAIALSLKRTTDSKLTYSMIPLALAVLSWGSSFFCGCRYLRCTAGALNANAAIILLGREQNPENTNIQHARKKQKDYSDRGKLYSELQFYLLICGALFFIGWHVIGMINATISSTG